MGLVKLAALPDADEPIDELVTRKAKAFARKKARTEAERWLPVSLPQENHGLPFGVAWFGDFHIDDDGCDIETLLRDCKLVATTPGLYGVHVGDYSNNWIGRLNSEHGKQSTTVSDARRLARHVIHGVGVPWLLWLIGNHDEWNAGGPILSLIADGAMHVAEWEARIELRANGEAYRIHTAHAFKGTSQWNPTHGPAKAALMGGGAELYVAGHIHTPGSQGFEIDGGAYRRAVQCRGYKHFDGYATRNGYRNNVNGACVLTVFHPGASTAAGRISIYEDMALGCHVLAHLRANAAASFDRKATAGKPKPGKGKAPAKRNARRRRA